MVSPLLSPLLPPCPQPEHRGPPYPHYAPELWQGVTPGTPTVSQILKNKMTVADQEFPKTSVGDRWALSTPAVSASPCAPSGYQAQGQEQRAHTRS